MKPKLLIYILPVLILAFMIYGYTTQDNPDFNSKTSNELIYQNSGVNSVFTTAAWTTLTPSPHAVSRSTCAYAKIGTTEYLFQFGGGSAAQLRNVARYNITANTWTNNYSTMPADISAGGTVLMNDSLIYVFGGFSPTLGKTLKYNYIANVWTTMANMTTLVTDVAVVKYNDSLVYVIGGGDGLFSPSPTLVTNAVQMYNIKSNTYTSAGTIPTATSMMGYGIFRDTILITAGWNGTAAVANSYKGVINRTTPTLVTWTTLPPYPVGAVTRMASHVVRRPGQGVGIACSGGAIGGSTLTAAGSLWNFCTQSWQALPNNSLARSNLKGSGPGDSIMYIVGGFTTVGVGNCEKITFSQIDGSCVITGIGNSGNINTPDGYNLSQNYPNPFNPTTKISFSIPKSGLVTLKIHDLSGKEVATLVNEIKNIGSYEIELKGDNLSSGTYIYRLETSDFVDTKKMILIK